MCRKTLKDVLILDDCPVFAEQLTRLTRSTVEPIITRDKPLGEILDSIKASSNVAEAIYMNAHLVFREIPSRAQCGGIELLKHIRLTPSLGNVCLLPIVLEALLPPKDYVQLKTDNLLVFSPGCQLLDFPFLPTALESALSEMDSFPSFDEMRAVIREFVIFTAVDESATRHDYRNQVGVAKFLKEFCGLSGEASHPALKTHQRLMWTELWLKKVAFLGRFRAQEAESISDAMTEKDLKDFERLTGNKNFIYIDDEHKLGWSSALYSGVVDVASLHEVLQSPDSLIETRDRRFICIDSYETAVEFFREKKNILEGALRNWAQAESALYEANLRLRAAQSAYQNARNTARKSNQRLETARAKLQRCEQTLDEKLKSFQQKANDFAMQCAEIVTEREYLQVDIQDETLQQSIEALNKAKGEYISASHQCDTARREYEQAQEEQKKSLDQQNTAQQTFQEKQKASNTARQAHDKAFFSLRTVFPYSLVFLDLRLTQSLDKERKPEDLSGVKLLKQIKELNPGIPVIVFTASESALSYEKTIELGADEYWIKAISTGAALKAAILRGLSKEHLRDIWLKIRQVEMKREIHCNLLTLSGGIAHRGLDQTNIERKKILNWLRESFLLLQREPASYEKTILPHETYDKIALNMGLIQEIRYKAEGERADIEGNLWWRLINANKIPSDETDLRELRKRAAHAFKIGRRGTMTVGPDSIRKEEAIDSFQLTLDRLLR